MILFFLNLRSRIFLFVSCNAGLVLVTGTVVVTEPGATVTAKEVSDEIVFTILVPIPLISITSPARSSDWKAVPKPVTVVPEPAVETVPVKVFVVLTETLSQG